MNESSAVCPNCGAPIDPGPPDPEFNDHECNNCGWYWEDIQ